MEDADENDVTRDINTPFDGVRNPLSKNNSLYTRWFIGYMTSIVGELKSLCRVSILLSFPGY